MQLPTQAKWHTAQWGTWGWLETIAKCIALAAGLIAFFTTPRTAMTLRGNPDFAALIVLALLTLAAVMQLVARLIQRETISVAFAIVNLLGHLALLAALAQVPHPHLWFVVFGVFYTLGCLIKIQFLRVTGYTEFGTLSSGIIATTVAILLLYVVFTGLMLLA